MALTDDLCAYWDGDEASGDIIDKHGDNDMVENGGTIGTSNGGRNLVRASSQFFSRAQDADLTLGASPGSGSNVDFTIALWARLATKSDYRVFFFQSNPSSGIPASNSQISYRLMFNFDSNCWTAHVGNESDNVAVNWGSDPAVDTWFFLMCRHNTTTNFLEGSQNAGTVVQAAWTGNTWAGEGPHCIGTHGGHYHDGQLKNIGFWKRALSDAEITELYNGGAGMNYAALSGGAGGGALPALQYQRRRRVNR